MVFHSGMSVAICISDVRELTQSTMKMLLDHLHEHLDHKLEENPSFMNKLADILVDFGESFVSSKDSIVQGKIWQGCMDSCCK